MKRKRKNLRRKENVSSITNYPPTVTITPGYETLTVTGMSVEYATTSGNQTFKWKEQPMKTDTIKNLLLDALTASAILCGLGSIYNTICDITTFNSPDLVSYLVIGTGTYLITKFLRN